MMLSSVTYLKEILEIIHKSKKHDQETHLIAVSKTFTEEDILPVLKAGQRLFGENRVQEAQKKWPSLKERFLDIELHLIGPLQSNKTSDAVKLFDVIHSVDREKIAKNLAVEMERQGKNLPVFIQVNSGREPQKAGILPEDADDFIKTCRHTYQLNVLGLMAIPPADLDPTPYFKELSDIAKRNDLKELSMGMSSDYQKAIQEGATYIRVGSALFGMRS